MKLYEKYKDKKLFSVKDIIICIVIILSLALTFVLYITLNNQGTYAEITLNGELLGKYSLNSDTTILIDNEHNIYVEIKDKKIAVIENDCLNQLCIKSGFISKTGEVIVCAPNKLTITIKGDNGGFDGVTHA